jgi:hypothetical protein
MNPQQYVGLFVRLFAIWLFFLAVQTVGTGVALDASVAHGRTLAPYILAALLTLAAVTLWCFPMFVAHKLVPPFDRDAQLPASAIEIATVACIVLGLWLCVARVFPSLVRYISVILVLLHEDVPLGSMDTKSWALLIESIIEFGAAAALVLKARTIARYLMAPRNAGRAR